MGSIARGRAADWYPESASSNPARVNIWQLTSAVLDYHEKFLFVYIYEDDSEIELSPDGIKLVLFHCGQSRTIVLVKGRVSTEKELRIYKMKLIPETEIDYLKYYRIPFRSFFFTRTTTKSDIFQNLFYFACS